MSINAYGLSRYIPADIRREVRKRSKFGCVVCRSAITQYEHIEPEWVDAKVHDPKNICLLCGRCHDKVTRGQLSKSTIRRSYEYVQMSDDVKPPSEEFDLSSNEITVVLGGGVFHGAKTLIELDGEVALAIEPPEDGASFPTLSGFFTDSSGKLLLKIDKNIWTGSSNAWDLEVEGKEIVIRLQKRDIALRLIVEPPKTIIVDTLNMRVGSGRLVLEEGKLAVGRVTPEVEYYVSLDKVDCHGAQIGVQVVDLGNAEPTVRGLNIVGGQGIELVGTGVKIGLGGTAHILGLGVEIADKQKTTSVKWDLSSSLDAVLKVGPPRI